MVSAVLWGACIGAVVGGGSSILNIGKSNKKTIKAFKKQMSYAMRNYNYQQAAFDRQERSMYDAAMVELFNMSLNTIQNDGSVTAALAETGLEGRNEGKVKQSMKAMEGLETTAVKEAHEQSVWEVRSAKDALYVQTVADFEQARDKVSADLIGGMRAVGMVMDGAAKGAVLGAVTAGAASAAGSALGSAATPATEGALTSVETMGAANGGNLLQQGILSTAGGTTTTTTAGGLGAGSLAAGKTAAGGVASLGTANTGLVTAGQYAKMVGMGEKASAFSKFSGAFQYNMGQYQNQLNTIRFFADTASNIGGYFNQPRRQRNLGYF